VDCVEVEVGAGIKQQCCCHRRDCRRPLLVLTGVPVRW
jgi:hypothetical protein